MVMVAKESGIGAAWANTTLHDLSGHLQKWPGWLADKNRRVGGGGHLQWQPRRAERKSAYPHVPTDQWDSIEDTAEAEGSIFGARISFLGLCDPKIWVRATISGLSRSNACEFGAHLGLILTAIGAV